MKSETPLYAIAVLIVMGLVLILLNSCGTTRQFDTADKYALDIMSYMRQEGVIIIDADNTIRDEIRNKILQAIAEAK